MYIPNMNIFFFFLITLTQKLCHGSNGPCQDCGKCTNQNLRKFPLLNPQLTSIHLDQNRISSTEAEDFKKLSNLQNITFTNNNLTVFPNLSYVSATVLYLDFSYNLIDFLTSDLLNFFEMLQTLLISNNLLDIFPPFVVNSLVINIDVSSNSLLTFPIMIGVKVSKVSVRIYDNPVMCDMKMTWVWSGDISGKCSMPEKQRGRFISDMQSSPTDFDEFNITGNMICIYTNS